jgi:putative flippase GtrA
VKKLKKMVDRTLFLYLLIGFLNFVLCTGIMFLLYNFAGFSKHTAPIVNYGLGSLIWYLACRFILFRGSKATPRQLLRFVVDIVVCYLVSYYFFSPMLSKLLLKSRTMIRLFSFGGAENIRGNCEMTIGTIAYSLLNYFGQRYYVFSNRLEHHTKKQNQE